MSLLSGIPLVGGLISGYLGYKDDKKQNKLNSQELALQKQLASGEIDISKYIEELAKQTAGLKGTFTDPYGGGAHQNPDGSWSSALSPQEKAIQDASYQEELDRNTHDQQIRRQGLDSAEASRARSALEATNALGDVNRFKQGFGRADEGRVASSIRADRTGAINAGYDDAARAAQTLELRTGNSGISDALTALARNRVRDTASIGNPELEAMQATQAINDQRSSKLYDVYKGFNDEGNHFYDAQFSPSTYSQDAYSKMTDAMKFDLSKLDTAMGGSAQAGAVLGNAAKGMTDAFSGYSTNRIANPTGKFIQGASQSLVDAYSQLFPSGMKFGG